MKRILVVGAGFSGAVFARELAEAGYGVTVIDRRPHIAGNAFDEVMPEGIRVHRYGPHLFHTNNKDVVDWITRFGAFVPYDHRVEAVLGDGRHVPLPINRTTVNDVFGSALGSEAEVEAFLATQAMPIAAPGNAAEFLYSRIGQTLTDLFFRPYTKKMWELDLEDMDQAVVKRIPLRFDDEDRYFPNDQYQIMPRDGYTRIFENIFDHDNIKILLNTRFEHRMVGEYDHCFNGMPIDEYFDFSLGPLPYRSIRFHHRAVPRGSHERRVATINFTDMGPRTRETDWSVIPNHVVHDGEFKILTQEEPCDYRDNHNERYYPVKTSDGRYQIVYEDYQKLAASLLKLSFIGRCGTYQYLDMHQVINQSLVQVRRWMRR